MKRKRSFALALAIILSCVAGEALAQKNKVKEKRYEPVTRSNVHEYEGKYVGIEDSYFLDITVATNGALEITSYEGQRRATLSSIRMEGAIVSATKVYADGGTSTFSGVFANRILNGRSAFGIIVDNLHIELDGITLSGLFYKFREGKLSSSIAPGETNGDVARREIEARYAEMAAAFENKDLETLQNLRTENFLALTIDGEFQTGAQTNERLRAMLDKSFAPVRITNTVERLVLIDDEAIVSVRREFSGIQNCSGRLCQVQAALSQRETWTRTSEGWKLKLVDNIRLESSMVDGQPMDSASVAEAPDVSLLVL